MSQGAYEPYLPEVSLHFRPEDMTPQELGSMALAQEAHDDPKHAIHHALFASQLWMSRNLTEEFIKGSIKYDQSGVAVAADTLWQLYLPVFQRAAAPSIANAYLRALAQVKAGDVDEALLYALANEHAARMGNYFHETSREAMTQGFNAYVNRKVPARAAAERVLSAYGLTPRQMSGMVTLEPEKAVSSSVPRDLKLKLKTYVANSLRQRLKVFSLQEDHNLEQQAQQFAWMWMVDKGQMHPETEKVWFTAKDERVCPICGPLHGKAVPVTEQFVTKDGKFWVPGIHVNCRCWVKIRTPRRALELVQKDLGGRELFEFNQEHPRGQSGRFRRKPVEPRPQKIVGVKERTTTRQGFDQIMRDLAARTEPISEAVVHVEPEVAVPKPLSITPPAAPAHARRPLRISAPLEVTPEVQKPAALSITPQRQGLVIGQPLAPSVGEELRPTRIDPSDSPYSLAPDLPKQPPRPRRAVEGVVRLAHPVYAVMPQAGYLSNQFQMNHEVQFTEDRANAIRQASDLRKAMIQEKVADHTQHYTVDYTFNTFDYEGRATARVIQTKITPEDLEQALGVMAAIDADEYEGDYNIGPLDYYDTDGNFAGRLATSVIDIANSVGVEPGDLNVEVVALDTAHESARGHVAQQDSGRHRPSTYTFSGYYEIYDEDADQVLDDPTQPQIPVKWAKPFDPEIRYQDD